MGKYIELEEIRKLCKDNDLDEQIINIKKNTKDVKKLIDDKLTGGKKAAIKSIESYIKELELSKIRKICKDKDLNKDIIKCTEVKNVLKIINDALSSSGIEVYADTVKEYLRELEIKEIREICTDKGLDEQLIKCAGNFEKAKEEIDAKLTPKEIKVSLDSVKEYIQGLWLEEVRKVCNGKDLNREIKKCSDNVEEAKKIIDAALPKEIKVAKDVIKKYIEELNANHTENIGEEIKEKKSGIAIGEQKLKEYDSLEYENNKLKNEIEQVKKDNEILKQRLKDNSEKIDSKNPLSQIPDLNDILNSNDEKITVAINKDLLSKATKIVVSRSLIRLENIIRFGNDLNSSIVQSIVLAFIHDNSLQ